MDDGKLPPPFLIGHTYCDREGEYTVIATDEDQITIERPDGRRTVADAALKARIHRNVVTERDTVLTSDRRFRQRKRREPTRRRKQLMERILLLEKDGEDHSGVEIDQLLEGLAEDLGYSKEDVSMLHPKTGRSVFANDGDWAKAEMTAERLHEVVGSKVYWDGDSRRECNVYRITPRGLEELRGRR
jgi:hypothetical protein